MANWGLRVRALLDAHLSIVLAVLVVLALGGAWVTYSTHISPDTITVERPTSSWETTGQFTHSATVLTDNPVYPNGTTLSNRSVYFTRITPVLDGTYRFTYDASEQGELNETLFLALVIRGVEQPRGSPDRTILWETTRPLDGVSVASARPGDTVRVPFSVNVSAIDGLTERIRRQFGGSPGEIEVLIDASVHLQGTVNGNPIDRTKSYTAPLSLEGSTYRLGTVGGMTDQYQGTRMVPVKQTYGPLRTIGGPILLFGPLLSLLGLVAARRMDRLGPSPTERELIAFGDDRADFEEWISTIRLPQEAFGLPRAEATSLGALVDFAIDTDNRVIEDPDDGGYYLVHNGYLYTYRPPSPGGEGSLTR